VPESGGEWRRFLTSLWIWAIWQTIRSTFILLVADAALFLLLMVILALGHYVIKWLPASQEKRVFLEKVHFYLVTGAWIFFSLTLFVELYVAFLKRLKDPLPHEVSEAREQSDV
jgi:hypothetical protein